LQNRKNNSRGFRFQKINFYYQIFASFLLSHKVDLTILFLGLSITSRVSKSTA